MVKQYPLKFLGFSKESYINLDLWDTAGNEMFDRLRPLSYREAHVFMLCFDITNQTSLENIEATWLHELARNYKNTKNARIMLVATKCDTKQENKDRYGKTVTIIPTYTIKDFICRIKSNKSFKDLFSNQMDIPYIETSAYKNNNVIKAFEIAIILGFRQISTYWVTISNRSVNCDCGCFKIENCFSKLLSCICNVCCFNYCCECCFGRCKCCLHHCTCNNVSLGYMNGEYSWVTVRFIGKGGKWNEKELIICGKMGFDDCDHKECEKYVITKKAEIDTSDKMIHDHPLVVTTVSNEKFYHHSLGDCRTHRVDKIAEWMTFINDYEIDWDEICPLRFDWTWQRIIWIGYHKNSENKQCLFGKLPKDMIKTILCFL